MFFLSFVSFVVLFSVLSAHPHLGCASSDSVAVEQKVIWMFFGALWALFLVTTSFFVFGRKKQNKMGKKRKKFVD